MGRPHARMPLGLLGMLILVALVESGVARRPFDFADRISAGWLFGRHAASTEARDASVLCLGDSQMKLGVQPRVIEARIGRPAYNLAVNGGQAPSTFYLLRRAIQAGARPDAIVVDFNANLLSSAPRFNQALWPALLDPVESFELGLIARDPDLLASILTSWTLPTLKDREGLRSRLFLDVLDLDRAEADDLRPYLRNWRANRGAQVTPIQGPVVLSADATGRGSPPGRSWKPHRANLGYLERTLRLASEYRITVYLLLPPLQPDWQSHVDRVGISREYESFLRELLARNPHLIVVDARRAGFGSESFLDEVHLHGPGSAILSEQVATALLDPIPPDRWIELPHAIEGMESVALEDVDASRKALRLRPQRR